MKKFLVALFAITSLSAYAETADTTPTPSELEAEAIKFCEGVGEIAQLAMTARQSDYPAQRVLDILEEGRAEAQGDEQALSVYELNSMIFTAAYDIPVVATDEEKQQYVQQFAFGMYQECLQELLAD